MKERSITGSVIIATGGREYRPTEYRYGEDPRVMTQIELGKHLEDKGADDLKHVVMIQCVGSRNEDYPNCSRICCQNAVKNALHIKELNPEANVYVLYRDIRTYGVLEDYYRKAREQGVLFFRFEKENPPSVESNGDGPLRVTFQDHVLQRDIRISPDLLVLSAGMRPEDTVELANLLKVARNPGRVFHGSPREAAAPWTWPTKAIFVCGTRPRTQAHLRIHLPRPWPPPPGPPPSFPSPRSPSPW